MKKNTIYCNIKFIINELGLVHAFFNRLLGESSRVNCPSKHFPFLRIVPGGTGFVTNRGRLVPVDDHSL